MRDEWNTTSKSKSKKVLNTPFVEFICDLAVTDQGWNTRNVFQDSGVFQQAGRGGRGPQTGGRGPGGRGDRVGGRGPGGATSGRGTSVARPTVSTSHQPTARSGDSAIVDHPVSQPAVVSGWGSPTATVTATASAPTIAASASSTAASTSSSGWGSGGTTLAEKLKLAEIQKLLPPPVLVVVVAAVEEMEEVSCYTLIISSSSGNFFCLCYDL